jgi:hypothetical protein
MIDRRQIPNKFTLSFMPQPSKKQPAKAVKVVEVKGKAGKAAQPAASGNKRKAPSSRQAAPGKSKVRRLFSNKCTHAHMHIQKNRNRVKRQHFTGMFISLSINQCLDPESFVFAVEEKSRGGGAGGGGG